MRTEIKNKHSKKTLVGESESVRCTPLPGSGTVNSDPTRASYMTYAEQIKSPQWQKKRLEILGNHSFKCLLCGNTESELHVHHILYEKNKMIWDYPNHMLVVLCDNCHKKIHEYNNRSIYSTWMIIEGYGFEKVEWLLDLLYKLYKK
jgi:5-methylcytosine-specific restriction endonuclease McrA